MVHSQLVAVPLSTLQLSLSGPLSVLGVPSHSPRGCSYWMVPLHPSCPSPQTPSPSLTFPQPPPPGSRPHHHLLTCHLTAGVGIHRPHLQGQRSQALLPGRLGIPLTPGYLQEISTVDKVVIATIATQQARKDAQREEVGIEGMAAVDA